MKNSPVIFNVILINMYNGLRMLKALSNLVFAAVILISLPAFAQLPNRDSVIIDSMNLLRPIHFSRDTGSEVRAVRKAYNRLYREQYQREKKRQEMLRMAPLLSLDSIWQHNYAQQAAFVDTLLTIIKDPNTNYQLRVPLIRLLSNTGHPKALRFLMQHITWMELGEGGAGGDYFLCFELGRQQADPWHLLAPMMTSICEDPHDEEISFMLFAQLLYLMLQYDNKEAYDGEHYATAAQTLVWIFVKKTELPDGSPNPQLLRFYEYLKTE